MYLSRAQAGVLRPATPNKCIFSAHFSPFLCEKKRFFAFFCILNRSPKPIFHSSAQQSPYHPCEPPINVSLPPKNAVFIWINGPKCRLFTFIYRHRTYCRTDNSSQNTPNKCIDSPPIPCLFCPLISIPLRKIACFYRGCPLHLVLRFADIPPINVSIQNRPPPISVSIYPQ